VNAAIVMEHAEAGRPETFSQERFERFYSETMPRLRSYIRRVGIDEARADDILQESYIRLLNAPPMRDEDGKPYLYRVATNLITDHWRQEQRQRRWWGWFARSEPAQNMAVDLSSDVRALFAQIGIRERALLWLAYVEGADHREIAEYLHLKEKSVKVLLFRARRKMEAILRKHGFEASHG
jgi:RNA polymerase sigma-70 factor, ECF subfamily